MQSITSTLNATQNSRVRDAMDRLRSERAETVQRIMTRIASRGPAAQQTPAIDPNGKLGNRVDVRA